MNVAIGATYRATFGLTQHILGIQRFSSHAVKTVPSSFARLLLNENYRRIQYYQLLMPHLKLSRYDIMHSHVDEWFTRLCQRSRNKARRWVHTYHGYYWEADYPDGLAAWQRSLNDVTVAVGSQADLRICVSPWLHDFLLDEFSVETITIPNACDVDRCARANPHRFRERYHLTDFVLYVGYSSAVKNPQLFIDLALHIPDMQFVMIGRGLDELHRSGRRPPNLLTIGELKHEYVLDALSACRVYVMTSKREGCPTSLLEAMAMAKPVVVSQVPGCRELVDHEEDGLLFSPDSIEDLVVSTRRALDANQMGPKAKAKVAAQYGWHVVARRLDAAYESLISS